MGQTSFDPNTVVSSWLSTFGSALEAKEPQSAAQCFLTDGWLRNSQIFCWDNRSLHGREKICQYITDSLSRITFSNFRVDDRQFLSPERAQVHPQHEGVKSGFIFETAAQWGHGYVQLLQDCNGDWRALAVYMSARDIKGHEEKGRELGIYGGHTVSWPTILTARRKEVEENPYALIIGGSQSGLMVGARFKQMNIPTLIIDALPRLGDAWRNRYESLILHTPRIHDQFLYQRFPQNWPLHTPKDKLANWIEHYADAQDLTVWTSSKPAEGKLPVYDEEKKRWTIVIDRAGQHVTIHPAHIICCMGTIGSRVVPEVKNATRFKGTVIHGADYKVPDPFANKRVVVVGAGNTGCDICLDLSVCAESITLVQRSKTTLIPAELLRNGLMRNWPDDNSVPMDVADFKLETTPINLRRQLSRIGKAGSDGGDSGKYAALYQGLREKGLVVDDGAGGEGAAFQVLEKFGGFIVDVGCSKLILSGRVGVKHGVEIMELKEESVVFTDGSEIPADVVIFATGFRPIYEDLLDIFGKETIERAGHLWGLDEEGEMRNVYRPTGHPALWYCAGGFQVCRTGSKHLVVSGNSICDVELANSDLVLQAMLLKAADLGLREV